MPTKGQEMRYFIGVLMCSFVVLECSSVMLESHCRAVQYAIAFKLKAPESMEAMEGERANAAHVIFVHALT